jgi:hypothetical protein
MSNGEVSKNFENASEQIFQSEKELAEFFAALRKKLYIF